MVIGAVSEGCSHISDFFLRKRAGLRFSAPFERDWCLLAQLGLSFGSERRPMIFIFCVTLSNASVKRGRVRGVFQSGAVVVFDLLQ